MDNFTPLKINKKNKINKFLIIGNISLFLVLSVTTSFIFKDKLIPSQQKASEPIPTQILIPTSVPTQIPTSVPTTAPTLIISPTPIVTQELNATSTPVVTQDLTPTLTPTQTLTETP